MQRCGCFVEFVTSVEWHSQSPRSVFGKTARPLGTPRGFLITDSTDVTDATDTATASTAEHGVVRREHGPAR